MEALVYLCGREPKVPVSITATLFCLRVTSSGLLINDSNSDSFLNCLSFYIVIKALYITIFLLSYGVVFLKVKRVSQTSFYSPKYLTVPSKYLVNDSRNECSLAKMDHSSSEPEFT